MNLKEWWSAMIADSRKRNPLTNFVLYAIQVVSLITVIALIVVFFGILAIASST